jgi:transposase InsO family protein
MNGCLHSQLGGMFWHAGLVTTDSETQYTSAVWASTCTRLGIEHVLTTAFHPQSNGMVERVTCRSRIAYMHVGQACRSTFTYIHHNVTDATLTLGPDYK